MSSPSREIVSRLRDTFTTGKTLPLPFRRQQLKALDTFLINHQSEIERALHQDLGRPSLEAFTADTAIVTAEISLALRKLSSWAKPRRVPTSLVAQPGVSRIHPQPLGLILIIAPWNFPLQLALVPLVGAIAAGNCAIIKPSELAPATSQLLATLLPKYLDPDCFKIVEGAIPETTALLAEKFDHIFYTGNAVVGRIIMQAAAQHLTPLTLELGGKSPCIVDQHTNLDVAAKRIAWGKFYNAGQVCIAPDYVLVHKNVESQLLEKLKTTITNFYGQDPRTSSDFGRIVNTRHHQRLTNLLKSSGTIHAGGQFDETSRYIAPTILTNVAPDSPIMQEEIFGPILPVLSIANIEEAIIFINARPHPLALYLFTSNKEARKKVINETTSGAVVINNTTLHIGVTSLPFGGIGPSGLGAYHGHHSFKTFSHHKPVLTQPTWPDLPLLYPPYTETKKKWIRRIL